METLAASTISCTDVATWPQITQFVVSAAGARVDYTPQTAEGTTVYSYDANEVTEPTNTGAGFNAEGITTDDAASRDGEEGADATH